MPQAKPTSYNLRRPLRSPSLSVKPLTGSRKSKLSHDITASMKPHTPKLKGPIGSNIQNTIERRCQHCHSELSVDQAVCDCVRTGQHHPPQNISALLGKPNLAAAASGQESHAYQEKHRPAFDQAKPARMVAGRRGGRFAP